MTIDALDEKQRLQSLKEFLHRYSAPAAEALIERHDNGDIQCFACGHRCLIKPGRDGVCRVRFNENGRLLVPFGYVGGVACDPIEKKPFFHVLPGSRRPQLRHARLRFPLRLLPELGHQPDAARSAMPRQVEACQPRSIWWISPCSIAPR